MDKQLVIKEIQQIYTCKNCNYCKEVTSSHLCILRDYPTKLTNKPCKDFNLKDL